MIACADAAPMLNCPCQEESMLDPIKIGNRIKTERMRKNISQESLAEMLYVSRQAVSKWEIGQTLPSIDNICFLVDIFQTNIDDLLCLNDDKPLSAQSLCQTKSRPFVLAAVNKGDVDFDLGEELFLFSPEERLAAVRAVKNYLETKTQNKLMEKLNLKNFWLKLTDEEKQLLDLALYKEEAKNQIMLFPGKPPKIK